MHRGEPELSNFLKVSVIVPAYNAQDFIAKCLDSLVNQTIDSYEVLVINDGSSDNTQAVVEAYHEKYPEIIKPFSKPNSGVAGTRNLGVSMACGEYISFVDCDDYVDFDYLERMYDKAKEEDADVVSSPVTYIRDDLVEKRYYSKRKFGKPAIDEPYILIKSNAYCPNKIYRRQFWLDNKFEFVNQWYEDSRLMYIVLLKANKVSCVNIPFYHYITYREGTAVGVTGDKVFDVFKSTDEFIGYFKEIGKFEEAYDTVEFLTLRHLFARVRALHNAKNRDLGKRFVKKMLPYLDSQFPDWRSNKYFETDEDDDSSKKLNAYFYTHDNLLMKYACGSSMMYSLLERSAAAKDAKAGSKASEEAAAVVTGTADNRYFELTVRDVRSIMSRAGLEAHLMDGEELTIGVPAAPAGRTSARIAMERAGYNLTDQYCGDGAAVHEIYVFEDLIRLHIRYFDPQTAQDSFAGEVQADSALKHYTISYSSIKRRTRETPEPVLITDAADGEDLWEKAYRAADLGFDPVVIVGSKKEASANKHPRVRCYAGDPEDKAFIKKIRSKVAGAGELRAFAE